MRVVMAPEATAACQGRREGRVDERLRGLEDDGPGRAEHAVELQDQRH